MKDVYKSAKVNTFQRWDNEDVLLQEDMIQDFIFIIYIFPCLIYGLRRYDKGK